MKITDIIREGWFSQIAQWLKNKITGVINSLNFGEKKTIKMTAPRISESADTKDVTGRIAEYACAYYLNESLKRMGKFVVETSSEELKQEYNNKVQEFKKIRSISEDQIQQGTDAGNKIAQEIYNEIIREGDDLAFTKYKFVPGDRISVRNPANEGNTADLILSVRKDSQEQVIQDITFSLKTYQSSKVSLGSSPIWMMLWKLFVDSNPAQIPSKGGGLKDFQVNPQEFAKKFGPDGEKPFRIKDANKTAAIDYLNSPEGQAWAKEKEAQRIARGKSPKDAKVKPTGNFLRDKGLGKYLAKNSTKYGLEPGQRTDDALAKLFTQLHDYGKVNLNQGDWRKYNEGIKSVLGFNVDASYAAICRKKGITVVNSLTSQNFKDLYQALNSQVDVVLTYKPGNATLGVKLVYENKELNTLTLSVWKDGTAQFQFDTGG